MSIRSYGDLDQNNQGNQGTATKYHNKYPSMNFDKKLRNIYKESSISPDISPKNENIPPNAIYDSSLNYQKLPLHAIKHHKSTIPVECSRKKSSKENLPLNHIESTIKMNNNIQNYHHKHSSMADSLRFFNNENSSQNLRKTNHTSNGSNTFRSIDHNIKTYPMNIIGAFKSRLKEIFECYSKYNDQIEPNYLNIIEFQKLIIDSQLIDNNLTIKKVESLFELETKNNSNVDFETFLVLLYKISQVKFKGQCCNDEQSMNFLVKDHIVPLYNNLYCNKYNNNEYNDIQQILNEPFDNNIIFILKNVHNKLFKIFQTYFYEESYSKNPEPISNYNNTQNNVLTLLNEFDIVPNLISINLALKIWNEVMNTLPNNLSKNLNIPNIIPFLEKDFGSLFTYSKFCAFLVRCALRIYTNHNFQMLSNSEKFEMLLNRIENSNKMSKLSTKTMNTSLSTPDIHCKSARKILKLDDQQITNELNFTDRNLININRSSNEETSKMNIKNFFERSLKYNPNELILTDISNLRNKQENQDSLSSRNIDYSQKKSYKPRNISARSLSSNNLLPIEYKLFGKYIPQLQNIFQFYCSLGDPTNKTTLKSIKFIKLLKECGLLQLPNSGNPKFTNQSNKSICKEKEESGSGDICLLSLVDADMIFSKLTGTKQTKDLPLNKSISNKSIKSTQIGYSNHLLKKEPGSIYANASLGKVDFENFLKAIEIIALKIFPESEIDSSIKIIIENYILKLQDNILNIPTQQRIITQGLKTLTEILQDEETVEFLEILHKSLYLYYKFYADAKSLMNFERFTTFCKEFGIFPDIIPKAKISTFFYTLSNIHKNSINHDKNFENLMKAEDCRSNLNHISHHKSSKSNINIGEFKNIDNFEDDFIDQHLFIEAIILCAFEIQYSDPQPSSIEKIIFILEKMNQSNGPTIIQKLLGYTRDPSGASWDILYYIRKKYPRLISQIQQRLSKTTLDSLIKSKLEKLANNTIY